ncbi:MAG: FAD:protein FMN transferase, partial [Steroidobacteraceae bacterium]
MRIERHGGLLAARFRAMGSPCELLAEDADAAEFHAAAQAVEREVARIEGKYTRFGRSGVPALLRRRAGRRVWVDAETAGLVELAAHWHRRSDGLFDIT